MKWDYEYRSYRFDFDKMEQCHSIGDDNYKICWISGNILWLWGGEWQSFESVQDRVNKAYIKWAVDKAIEEEVLTQNRI